MFEIPDGTSYQIYDDGSVYDNRSCEFVDKVFEQGFEVFSYIEDEGRVYRALEDGARYEVVLNYKEDFEGRSDLKDLFITDLEDRSRLLTNMTLQSPSAKTVNEYQALRNCIWNETCDFIDSKIELTSDPVNPNNTVIKFHAVAPSNDMITSKCSVSSDVLYFPAGEDFWFQGRYFLEKGQPTTIADFESSHMLRWGPRASLQSDELVIENKFMDKKTFLQNSNSPTSFPSNQWVEIKVHFRYHETDGVIQVWQDGQLIVDHIGENIPLSNWVQDVLEIGISATDEETILYMDDLQFGLNDF